MDLKRKKQHIKFIIIHYTGMQSKRASLDRLLDPKYEVSCHYLIDRKGNVIKIVDDMKIAWHAGKSKWKNYENLNKNSIGIELVNRGHQFGYQSFTSIQIKKLINICLILKKKYKIKKSNILGHSDIAPLRKKDPGEKFPWKLLSEKGLGIWYYKKKFISPKYSSKVLRGIFFKNLHKIGFRYFSKRVSKKNDDQVIRAFKRRFLQKKIDSKINQETLDISHYLANKL